MALLAEEIVEEWLNRNGFFTIRGIKLGVHEIDLLAVGYRDEETICRHVEVQASVRPISYLRPLPKETQKATGRRPMSVKERSKAEIKTGVAEWLEKKYHLEAKKRMRERLFPGKWHLELVVHHVKYKEEIQLMKKQGITIHRLDNIVKELASKKTPVASASGRDLLELIMLGSTAGRE